MGTLRVRSKVESERRDEDGPDSKTMTSLHDPLDHEWDADDAGRQKESDDNPDRYSVAASRVLAERCGWGQVERLKVNDAGEDGRVVLLSTFDLTQASGVPLDGLKPVTLPAGLPAPHTI
jgi:hypothetical protein